MHILHLNAGSAEILFQILRHNVHMVFGVGAGGIAFAADENAHHTAAALQNIVDFQRILRRKGLVHQLLPGMQVHHAGSVGGQRVLYAGDGGERRRNTAGSAPRSGQHHHPLCTGCAQGRQRAGGDFFFVIEHCTVQIQRHKPDILHIVTLLSGLLYRKTVLIARRARVC